MKPKTISQKKRRDKLCGRNRRFYKMYRNPEDLNVRVLQIALNKSKMMSGTWTYNMNGEEKVFSPVTVEGL